MPGACKKVLQRKAIWRNYPGLPFLSVWCSAAVTLCIAQGCLLVPSFSAFPHTKVLVTRLDGLIGVAMTMDVHFTTIQGLIIKSSHHIASTMPSWWPLWVTGALTMQDPGKKEKHRYPLTGLSHWSWVKGCHLIMGCQVPYPSRSVHVQGRCWHHRGLGANKARHESCQAPMCEAAYQQQWL